MSASHPFEGLPRRDKLPATARALDAWINQAQDKVGIAAGRIGWLVASSVVIAALQRARHVDDRPRFLLKGGTYLELKLGIAARATKDVDALFRGSFDEFVETLDSALLEPWGVVELSRTEITVIEGAKRLVKPCRFKVKLSVKGRVWRTIDVEVSADEAPPAPMSPCWPGRHWTTSVCHPHSSWLRSCSTTRSPRSCTPVRTRTTHRPRSTIELGTSSISSCSSERSSTLTARRPSAPPAPTSSTSAPPKPTRSVIPAASGRQRIIAFDHWRIDFAALATPLLPGIDLDDAVEELNAWIAGINSAR